MGTETYQAQLERVQAAIAKIETSGQAYEIDGRKMTRADLSRLYAREDRLRGLAASEADSRAGKRRVRSVEPNF